MLPYKCNMALQAAAAAARFTVSSSRNCRSLHCLSKFAENLNLKSEPPGCCLAERSLEDMALSDGGSGSREAERTLKEVERFEQSAATKSKKEAKIREAEISRQVPASNARVCRAGCWQDLSMTRLFVLP